jgi:transcriptional regulator with XRE-family HTH domain
MSLGFLCPWKQGDDVEAEGQGPAVARALLCAELKRLRTVFGETQEAAAAACEWSLAKFSRIENGTQTVRKADLEALLRHYNLGEDQIEELTQLARVARAPGWWDDYDLGQDRGFQAYVGYEDGASSIRMWQPLVIPGLLQTAQYTQEILEAWGVQPKAIAREVRLREERQRRITVRAPEQYYLLDEAVIRRHVGTVMSEQLRHLARVAQKPAVTIRVIPFNKGPHFGLQGPFTLLGFAGPLDDVLYLESARRGDLLIAQTGDQYVGSNVLRIEDPADEVSRYENSFQGLLKLALDSETSLEIINQVAGELAS